MVAGYKLSAAAPVVVPRVARIADDTAAPVVVAAVEFLVVAAAVEFLVVVVAEPLHVVVVVAELLHVVVVAELLHVVAVKVGGTAEPAEKFAEAVELVESMLDPAVAIAEAK